MVFSNAVFLFVFLPIVIGGYFVLKKNSQRNIWLLLVSLFFYAWNNPKFTILLLVSIIINYIGALLISTFRDRTLKKTMLFLCVLSNLGMLFYFKYFNFILDILGTVFKRPLSFSEVILPIGISFFTFQGVAYVVDIYRNEVPAQKKILKLALYISLFPKLTTGPIVRYKTIAEEIDNRTVTLDDFTYGIRRFIVGLFKKIIVADTLAVIANCIFERDPYLNSVAIAWLGIVAYSFQILFDFSGYSDMAIGLGRMFGFHFIENFNYPYISKSITEFWRRWHISLSSFFRDYVYIPLGGNRKHQILNVAIVFLLTGIWHGAAYTFIVWGIWHGFFNIVEKILNKKNNKPTKANLGISIFQHVYTIIVVMIGWVFFRSPSLSHAMNYILSMFGLNNTELCIYNILFFLDKWTISIFAIAFLMSTPLIEKIYEVIKVRVNLVLVAIGRDLLLIGMLVLSILQVASNTYSAFIYFQF